MNKEEYEVVISTLVEKINKLESDNRYLNWCKENLENKLKEVEKRPQEEHKGVEKR